MKKTEKISAGVLFCYTFYTVNIQSLKRDGCQANRSSIFGEMSPAVSLSLSPKTFRITDNTS